MRNERLHITSAMLMLLACILIFACCRYSPVDYSIGDSRGSLLVSKALFEHATIQLDEYAPTLPDSYQFQKKNGHTYYYFPIGTSIFATPLVAIAVLLDKDPMIDNTALQRVIAGIFNILIFAALYLLARNFLDKTASAVVSASFWFSTSLVSILTTALWSHNLAIFFATSSLWLCTRNKMDSNDAAAVGICLFLSYLCRPTMALLSIALVPFVLLKWNPRLAITTVTSLTACLFIFVFLSWLEFGQPLPDYYLPKRLSGDSFWVALYANMLSPSRGFLIYTPTLLVLFLNPSALAQSFRKNIALWICMPFWIFAHWISISRFPHWWGGFSYGPRLMVDILPAVFILTVSTISKWEALSQKSIATQMALLVTLLGVAMHTYQGTINVYSGILWNVEPLIETNNQYIFDWKYPQFLHTEFTHTRRNEEHQKQMDEQFK